MQNKRSRSLTKKTLSFIAASFFIVVAMFIFSKCNSPKETSVTIAATIGGSGIDYTQYKPPPDIASQNENANLTELAEFAWQEFIALNWPVISDGRGAPDTSNSFLAASKAGNSYTPVWQTYWHRNELFPANGKTPVEPSTTNNSPPNYQYSTTYDYSGNGTGNYTLWNNLDEVNEIGQDVVFAHSTTTDIDSTYQVLYEAKMNFDGANYVYGSRLYDKNIRTKLLDSTKNNISENGICGADSTKYVSLPCGNLATGREGNIEIKAAWRPLDSTKDTIANYHTQKVIYYHNEPADGSEVKQVYKNATMGLVGLHIIHKTETFPDFVFATWEHKANLSSGIVYTEIATTPFGDKAKDIKEITREHPIPNSITAVNDVVQKYLSAQNSVWQHYKLINVQAKPRDVSTITGSRTDTINSSYFLSNSVIESNIELQTFTGKTSDPKFQNVIYKGNKINMGGCMGCHGVAQSKGADFNFLIANAPFAFPEFTGIPEPGCPTPLDGEPFAINYWEDVLKLFNNCVVQTTIGNSPHSDFWQKFGSDASDQKMNYCLFTTGNVPGVRGDVRICTPNDSTSSNIIIRLKGLNNVNQMPGGGPYFSPAQITELAKWIQNGCVFDDSGSYTYTDCQ